MSKPFGSKSPTADSGAAGQATAGSAILGKLIGGQQQTVGGKSKVPAYIPNTMLERLRNTVVGMQRDPGVDTPPVSLSAFVEAAVERAIVEAEEQYNGGSPYPTRPNPRLKSGPPIQG
ncbi:hypothetical protein [Streptomyces abikoensis]